VDWDMYSHIVLDGKKTNKSAGVTRQVMNLFMRLNPWSADDVVREKENLLKHCAQHDKLNTDEKRTRTTENKPQFEHKNLNSKTVPTA
jgi:hypothetical protein